jgi:hypothetical protein
MRTYVRSLFALLLSLTALAQSAPKPATEAGSAAPARLPVRRVVLYKNGVGYFEHTGRVRGDQDLAIDFTTAQLNDVLKSLTVLDLGEGRVTGIRYDSIAPLDVRMKGLRLPVSQNATEAEFLNAIRGARVEVRSGTAISVGRVLSVEKRTRTLPRSDQTEEFTELSLVTDAGELRTFEVGPATGVRVLDKDLGRDIDRYLNLISSSRSSDMRRMVIGTAGTGERDLFVSYISEVPVWKSTYRALLRKDDAPLLQGWAIVDNTVGEDWNNVQLTLVAGAPQSFIQNLSQPIYTRRPVVALPQAAMLTPQAHEGTMQFDRLEAAPSAGIAGGVPGGVPGGQMGGVIGGIVNGPLSNGIGSGGGIGAGRGAGIGGGIGGNSLQGTITDPAGAVIPNAQVTYRNQTTGQGDSTRTDSAGRYFFRNVQPGQIRLEVSSPGFNTMVMNAPKRQGGQVLDATLNVGAANETVAVEASPAEVETSMAQLDAEAVGGALGDLFEYALKQRISIGKDQSALVPIINKRVAAEKVTLWNDESQQPLRALWLTNTTGLTLDAGTFNVVEDGAFAGEGLIEPLKPAEKRLLSYAADTAVRVTTADGFSRQPVTVVRIARGVMRVTREQRQTRTYTIHNSDTAARDVIIEHEARPGWKLAEGLKPEETTASFHRFRVKVEANATEKLEIKESRPDTDQLALVNITPEQIALFVQEKTITPEIEQSLRRILEKKAEIGGYDQQTRARQQEVDSIGTDQARLRENMKALKGSAEEKALLQRYTKQLDSQEDRLATLHKEMADLKQKRDAAGAELDRMVMALSWEEKM